MTERKKKPSLKAKMIHPDIYKMAYFKYLLWRILVPTVQPGIYHRRVFSAFGHEEGRFARSAGFKVKMRGEKKSNHLNVIYAKHEILCPHIALATINYPLSNAEWPMIEAIVSHKQRRNEPVVPNRSFTIPFLSDLLLLLLINHRDTFLQ